MVYGATRELFLVSTYVATPLPAILHSIADELVETNPHVGPEPPKFQFRDAITKLVLYD
jgi:hypothetical protein